MYLADLSIKRPILISMGLIVFLLFGVIAYFGMNLELTPRVDLPMITIQVIYPGAGPLEIESQISKKLEDAVSSISRIRELRSYSMENLSLLMLQFELDKDVNIANQEVKDKVDGIFNQLPRDIERPVIQKFDPTQLPIVELVLSGDMPIEALYEIADKKLKDRFSQIEGVANVEISGGVEREFRVEFDNRTVFQQALSLQQLSQILQAQNIDIPGGHFSQRSQEYSVRLDDEFESLETLRNLEIPTTRIEKTGGFSQCAGYCRRGARTNDLFQSV